MEKIFIKSKTVKARTTSIVLENLDNENWQEFENGETEARMGALSALFGNFLERKFVDVEYFERTQDRFQQMIIDLSEEIKFSNTKEGKLKHYNNELRNLKKENPQSERLIKRNSSRIADMNKKINELN